MALAGPTVTVNPGDSKQSGYFIPLVLVTSLFFLWGMAYGLLDVLNKHFQETLNVTRSRSTLLQAAYFGAYFCEALPAGIFMNKYGYKKGILLGLILYAAGAFLFFPAAEQMSFNFFLFATFVIASGLTCLETAANPYVTVLGAPETGPFRLNLSQCFNGVGSFIGPVIAANLFFGDDQNSGDLASVKLVYIVIGAVVLVVAAFFFRTPLPEIRESELTSSQSLDKQPLIKHPNFVAGVAAQFFYVSAQVGIAALFINYCTESGNRISNSDASYLLGVSLLLFTIGRFTGTALMRKIAANRLLMTYAIVNIALCFVVAFVKGWIPVYSLMSLFFFQSIMFPTIFALAVKDLGHHTKKGSSFLVMAIVGGACMPYIMGLIAEQYSTARSYLVPMLCFINVAWYGWKGYRVCDTSLGNNFNQRT
jgi:FHS family L-fucose permease-like MFS transporter